MGDKSFGLLVGLISGFAHAIDAVRDIGTLNTNVFLACGILVLFWSLAGLLISVIVGRVING